MSRPPVFRPRTGQDAGGRLEDGTQAALQRATQQQALRAIDCAATQKFDTVLITMNSILKDIDDLVLDSEGDLAITMKESRYVVESISRNIDAMTQNMDGAARNLYEFSRQIRQNPGLLLGGTSPEDKGAVK